METREYAEGTSLTVRMPWSVYVRARVLCPDGTVRTTSRIAPTPDTFFSVPAAVKVSGKTVSGFLSLDEDAIRFTPNASGKNAALVAG